MVKAGTTPEKVNEIKPRRSGTSALLTLPVDAASHRHVHLIDAGIHVQDETVHAPAGFCADKGCETTPLLKWRLDRYVLTTERRAGNGGHRGPHHARFRRG
jgi:hypothetical protein